MRRISSLFFIFLFLSFAIAQDVDRSGVWAGTLITEGTSAGIELTLLRDGDIWKPTLKVRLQGQEISPPVLDLVIQDESVTFRVPVGNRVIRFAGKFEGDALSGPIEVFQNDQKVGAGTFAIMRGGVMPPLPTTPTNPGQIADPNFDASVNKPAYKKDGPRVLFDEAHHNFHTATGRYRPFADLITSDGYRIVPGKQKFSTEALKDYRVLIISNALGAARMNDPSASDPAFTDAESDAVRDWVKSGGSLLLIADHAPMGSANQILGQRFGVDMSKKYTIDNENFQKESGNRGFIVYTSDSGRLAKHAITEGRDKSERINKVIAFTGQSLKGPAESFAFMKLADSAQDVLNQDSPISAAGRAQGIAMKFGKGRVVFMAEAGMLTAQVTGPQRSPCGRNVRGIDKRQLVLNIMHWLTKKL
jgi:hypothetical protein